MRAITILTAVVLLSFSSSIFAKSNSFSNSVNRDDVSREIVKNIKQFSTIISESEANNVKLFFKLSNNNEFKLVNVVGTDKATRTSIKKEFDKKTIQAFDGAVADKIYYIKVKSKK